MYNVHIKQLSLQSSCGDTCLMYKCLHDEKDMTFMLAQSRYI